MTETKGKNFWLKAIIVGLAVLAVLYLAKNKSQSTIFDTVREETSALKPIEGSSGNAVATRSYENKTFKLSVTAFLPKGKIYSVWLVNDAKDPKRVSLGKMNPAGDAYSLNYISDKDYRDYKEVVIAQENPEKDILKGSF